MRRTSSLDLLAREFADAVSEGNPDRAEGWLRVAQAVAAREPVWQRPGRLAWTWSAPRPRLIRVPVAR